MQKYPKGFLRRNNRNMNSRIGAGDVRRLKIINNLIRINKVTSKY